MDGINLFDTNPMDQVDLRSQHQNSSRMDGTDIFDIGPLDQGPPDTDPLGQGPWMAKREQQCRRGMRSTPRLDLPTHQSSVLQGLTPVTTPSMSIEAPFSMHSSNFLSTPPSGNPACWTEPHIVCQYGSSRSEPGGGRVHSRYLFQNTAMTDAGEDSPLPERLMNEFRDQLETPPYDHLMELRSSYIGDFSTRETYQGDRDNENAVQHFGFNACDQDLSIPVSSASVEAEVRSSVLAQHDEGAPGQLNTDLIQDLPGGDGSISVLRGPLEADIHASGFTQRDEEPWSQLNLLCDQYSPVRSGPTQGILPACYVAGHSDGSWNVHINPGNSVTPVPSRVDQSSFLGGSFITTRSESTQEEKLVPAVTQHDDAQIHRNSFFGNQSAPFQSDMPRRTRPAGDALGKSPSFDRTGPLLGASESHDHEPVALFNDTPVKKNKGGRVGPLTTECRKLTSETREEGSCWHCKLQRYSCIREDGRWKCERCIKSSKTSSKWPWGCIKLNLPDLISVILPGSLLSRHESEQKLLTFVHGNIREWTHNLMHIDLTWGHGGPIGCDVHEFRPRGDYVLAQDQYRVNMATGIWELVRVPSVHLGMKKLLRSWRPTLLTYMDNTIKSGEFINFPRHCFRGGENEVQRKLISSLHKYYLALPADEQSCSGDCLRALICTQIMTRTLTPIEGKKEEIFKKLVIRPEPNALGIHTGMKLLNKQIKYVIREAHKFLLKKLLENIQKVLQASNKQRSWGPAFVTQLTLAMVFETLQHQIRCRESSEKGDAERAFSLQEKEIYCRIQEKERAELEVMTAREITASTIQNIEKRAQAEIAEMEEKIKFVQGLFHFKYSMQDSNKAKVFNPVQNERVRTLLDRHSQILAQELQTIIEDHDVFLDIRKSLGPPTDPGDSNASRLVAHFLASFK